MGSSATVVSFLAVYPLFGSDLPFSSVQPFEEAGICCRRVIGPLSVERKSPTYAGPVLSFGSEGPAAAVLKPPSAQLCSFPDTSPSGLFLFHSVRAESGFPVIGLHPRMWSLGGASRFEGPLPACGCRAGLSVPRMVRHYLSMRTKLDHGPTPWEFLALTRYTYRVSRSVPVSV